jgi:dihydroneopterin aldolase
MDHKIEILGISCESRLGTTPEERKKPQKIAIDLVLSLDLTDAARKDDLSLTPDYWKIERLTRNLASKGERSLAERLAWDIALHVLDEDTRIKSITVRVHKTPKVMPKTREVIIEISKSKPRRQRGKFSF